MEAGALTLTVGVIGHVDHGKTALVRALTGMETDRLEEEKRRGISIALGFAHFRVGGAVIDLIDMPGHERFVRTMIAGATGVRAVLLVIAANEGVRPQTVEHAEIAALLGVRDAILVLTKCDATEREAIAATEQAGMALAERCGLRLVSIHHVSALTGAGIEDLKAAFAALAQQQQALADRGLAYLPIDRAFSITGHGTVVTGTLRGGPIAAGDEMEVLPGGRRLRVRAVQVRGQPATSALPGQRTALNLRGVAREDVPRGYALATPRLLTPSGWLTVALRAVASSPGPLAAATRLRLLVGTGEAEAILRLLDREELAPGETCFAQLRCVPRVAVPAGEHVVLRLAAPTRAVAGGRVLDPVAQRLRRGDQGSLEWLALLAAASPEMIVSAGLERAGPRGASVLGLARLAGLSLARTEAALRAAGAIVLRGHAVTRSQLASAQAALLRALARSPYGLQNQRVRATLPAFGQPVLDMALAGLSRSGRIEAAGGRVRIMQAAQEARRREDEAGIAVRLAQMFRRAGFMPPTAPQTEPSARRGLERLVREGILIRAYDRVQRREVLFHAEAIEQAKQRLRPILERGATVSEVGSALGITRKYSVPLLEYLDAVQFTRRVGDGRRLREHPFPEPPPAGAGGSPRLTPRPPGGREP